MSSFLENESDFGFDDLFFSRTNVKGIIESSNSVFQRVSKYDWEELFNKPHNVIRHPAMPRGVFHLLWETILSGKSIGAYVINKAKDGSYYWVFALVSPVEGGFLSVRLKPSSPLFMAVKTVYADLLKMEQDKRTSPKESQTILLETLQKLNFRNYDHFMTEALTQELEHRQKALNLDPIQIILQLREVLKLGTQLQKKCEEIFSSYRTTALVSLNLEVQAAKIGQEAAPISVISSEYEALAKQIQQEIHKFVQAGSLVQRKVEECQFDVCNSLLQTQMLLFFKEEVFKEEAKQSHEQKNVEMKLLESLSAHGIEKAKVSLGEIDAQFRKFKSIHDGVKQLSTAIEIVSITGKMEAARIKQSSSEIIGLLHALENFKTSLKQYLHQIDMIGNDLVSQTHKMKERLV